MDIDEALEKIRVRYGLPSRREVYHLVLAHHNDDMDEEFTIVREEMLRMVRKEGE